MTRAPIGDVGVFRQSFVEDFDVDAAADGPFLRTYARSFQPYADGTGGRYWCGSQISAHDGVMDVRLDGERGAAGAFGRPEDAWSHVGGRFSMRARAIGGDGNGVAVMLWPGSDIWADGELDYPEGNFDAGPGLNHHSMVPGRENEATSIGCGVDWREWHTYATEWIPGVSVRYLLDDEELATVTEHVPTTPHRYMFQVGNWGAPGSFQMDWVTTYELRG
jgi:hypothetical protein